MSSQKESTEHREGSGEVVRLLRHGRGATALRLGLGPDLRPAESLKQLQRLLNGNAFWAKGRSLEDLGQMVKNSAVCVTAWQGRTLVGFGRATSDGVYRGTLWDLVVDSRLAGRGVGRSILRTLLSSRALAHCERVYLMTTNSAEFYKKMGFQINQSQKLMIKEKSG
ncbi:MAG: GNAT family N-acetyltransferase [Sphaerospermopsis kisseleviana]